MFFGVKRGSPSSLRTHATVFSAFATLEILQISLEILQISLEIMIVRLLSDDIEYCVIFLLGHVFDDGNILTCILTIYSTNPSCVIRIEEGVPRI